jgi:hypothetical protein
VEQAALVLFGALLTLSVQYLTDRLREGRQERLERKRRRAVEREAAFREMAEMVPHVLIVLERVASGSRRNERRHPSWWEMADIPLRTFEDRWLHYWRFLFAHDGVTEQHVKNVRVLRGSFDSRQDDSIGLEDVEGFIAVLRAFREHCLRQAALD